METSDKCLCVVVTVGLIVAVVVSIIDMNLFEFFGWFIALMMFVYGVVQESKLYESEAEYSESVREKAKMQCEIAKLKARIRELESEDVDDGK